MMRILTAGILLAMTGLLLSGCGGGGAASVPSAASEGLAITVPRDVLQVGETTPASVQRAMIQAGAACPSGMMVVEPTPGVACMAYNGQTGVTWMCCNRDVATVDSQGNLTAVGCGQTYLAATMRNSDGTKVLSAAIPITVIYDGE